MRTQQSMICSLFLVALSVVTSFSCQTHERVESPDVASAAGVELRAADLRASCKDHLKTLGIVLQMFGSESRRGDWPPLDQRPGRLFFKAEDIFPLYLSDTRLLVCPAQKSAAEIVISEDAPALFDDQSYFYLGYAMYNEEMGLAFLDAYRRVVEAGGDFEGRKLPLVAPTRSAGHGSLRRFTYTYSLTLDRSVLQIHYGLDKELAFSDIPVMVERLGHHIPMGGHVLYLDGHVEYLRYPGRFPMSKSFIEGLYRLDALGPKLRGPEGLDLRSREDDAQSERQ